MILKTLLPAEHFQLHLGFTGSKILLNINLVQAGVCEKKIQQRWGNINRKPYVYL